MTLVDATPRARAAEELIANLRSAVIGLERRPHLRPGSEVDALFGQVVRLAVQTPAEVAREVLAAPAVQDLAPRVRSLCAQGEAELELAWARRIVTSRDPLRELRRFPYLDNYRLLSRMEMDALASACDRPVRSVAFAGSGPLPLTSLILAGELGVPVDNIDRDARAVSASRAVAAALGRTDIRVHHMDVADADLTGFDVVILAALVGDTPEAKTRMLLRLGRALRRGAILLVRSARGLRTLLYPEAPVESLAGFEVLATIHPDDEVVNSVIVARVPRAGFPAGHDRPAVG